MICQCVKEAGANH